MKPESITLEPFTEGDHWEGIPAITILINDEPPASALSGVRIRFTKDVRTVEVVELTSADDQITIVDANAWELSIPEQAVPGLTAGKWRWNLETTNAAGVVKTYLEGTLLVLRDV
jgi:hypothetical protein